MAKEKDLFSAREALENTGMTATFDTVSPLGQLKSINAKNGSSTSLKDLEDGTSIQVKEIMLYKDIVDNYGQEQESVITVLFDEAGQAYSSISPTVEQVAIELVPLLKEGVLTTIKCTVVKNKSKQGQEYISLAVSE